MLYIYGRFSGKGYGTLFFSILFLIGFFSIVGTYWYAFGLMGVVGIIIYLSSFVYLLYKKFPQRSIFFGLFLAVPVIWLALLFVNPFLFCQYPEVFHEYDTGYRPPLLTQTFADLGLLQNCNHPLHVDPQLFQKLQLSPFSSFYKSN